ncbi:MAG: hypothetical protein ABEH81_01410 [Halopenitus sp.]
MSDSEQSSPSTDAELPSSNESLDNPEQVYEAADVFLKQVIASYEHLGDATSEVQYLTNENTNRTSVRLTDNQKEFVEDLKKTQATTSREIAIGICVGFAMNYQEEFNDYLSEYLLRSLDHTFEPDSQNTTTEDQDSEQENKHDVTEEELKEPADIEERAESEVDEFTPNEGDENTDEIEFDDDPDEDDPFGGNFDIDDI